jgi:hypothetical protein
MVEVTFEEDSQIRREIEIPISEQGHGVGGAGSSSHCDDKLCEYEYNAGAWKSKKDKFRIRFAYIYPRKWKSCNFEKFFIVEKNQPYEMQIKCGVKLKARYAKVKKDE